MPKLFGFSPNNVSTFRFSYGTGKTWFLIKVFTLPCGMLCVSVFWVTSGLQHFTTKFPYEVAVAKC